MNDEIEIVDSSHDRDNFTMIPNLIDDSGLSPYAVRLYMRLKRRAGETGKCWENTRHLAEGCAMSIGQVTKAKRELSAAGLIDVSERQGNHGHFPGHNITIKDVWLENSLKYTRSSSGFPIHTVNRTQPPVHTVNTTCSPGGIKEYHFKKEVPKTQENSVASTPPLDTPEKPSGVSIKGSAFLRSHPEIAALKNHPAIQAIHEITNLYPPPELYQLFIDRIGENPNKYLLFRIKTYMAIKGHNKKNWSEVLDKYENYLYDIHSDDKTLVDCVHNPYEEPHKKPREGDNIIEDDDTALDETGEEPREAVCDDAWEELP